MKLIVLPQALEDLRHIEMFIGQDNPKAAVEFVGRLTERFQQLTRFPRMGRKRDEIRKNYRSITEGEYVIIYREVDESKLAVLRVLHAKLDTFSENRRFRPPPAFNVARSFHVRRHTSPAVNPVLTKN